MRSRNLFLASLSTLVLLYVVYGLHRFTLGIDCTDEGSALAWPLRMLFGEQPFTSELMTLTRPVEVYLYLPFELFPGLTLYQCRLAGWGLHLLAFGVLSVYLFRLSDAPLRSPLLASIPFFACHIFGQATPNYNTLSCDFLLLALTLRGLMALPAARAPTLLGVLSGLALFLATFSHPGLGLVGACFVLRECWTGNLLPNLWRRRLSPGNAGVAVFLACWAGFALYFAASGALYHWAERLALAASFSANSLHSHPGRFLVELAAYPFVSSPLALGCTVVFTVAAVALYWFHRHRRREHAVQAGDVFGFLLFAVFVINFCQARSQTTSLLAQTGIVLLLVHGFIRPAAVRPDQAEIHFLLLMSGLGAVAFATLTYYFDTERSWVSGTLALPFAYAVGLALLIRPGVVRPGMGLAQLGALFLAVAGLATDHAEQIQRDAPPGALRASFTLPKLQGIKSTPERVHSLQELCDYLHPRMKRGEPLLIYDNCPMLYFLLDARPAYGLAAADRYGLIPTTLQQLNREFLAQPLPRYAIRTLVNVAQPVWADAPRTHYEDYPLNASVLAHYNLERTIFPFEIWRRKPRTPAEMSSPDSTHE